MADRSETVRVEGLAELRKELKRLDEGTFSDELKDAHFKVASMVADRAKGAATFPVQRKASASLTASRTANKAQVGYGGPAYPYAMGAEFGSNRYRQFPAHRGREGYFLYPTIRDSRDETIRIYGDAIEKITKKAFPD